jgi:hypothetical protein
VTPERLAKATCAQRVAGGQSGGYADPVAPDRLVRGLLGAASTGTRTRWGLQDGPGRWWRH